MSDEWDVQKLGMHATKQNHPHIIYCDCREHYAAIPQGHWEDICDIKRLLYTITLACLWYCLILVVLNRLHLPTESAQSLKRQCRFLRGIESEIVSVRVADRETSRKRLHRRRFLRSLFKLWNVRMQSQFRTANTICIHSKTTDLSLAFKSRDAMHLLT